MCRSGRSRSGKRLGWSALRGASIVADTLLTNAQSRILNPQITLRRHVSGKCDAKRLKLGETIGDRHGWRGVKLLASL
jgi:hypothetical protein